MLLFSAPADLVVLIRPCWEEGLFQEGEKKKLHFFLSHFTEAFPCNGDICTIHTGVLQMVHRCAAGVWGWVIFISRAIGEM